MYDVKSDFNKRKSEIEEYMDFVNLLTDDLKDSKISFNSVSKDRIIEKSISDQLEKVLIANGFLLLYNLIEATMRNSLSEIFDQISNEGVDYGNLSLKFRTIWLSQSTSNLRQNFRSETLTDTVKNIANSVLETDSIILDKDKLNFSGNLDAKKIRSLAVKYGFNQSVINADNLLTIKNKRNYLAHGDYSFSDIGKDFSSGDLIDFKDETIAFLQDVITQIELFINEKKYLIA